jgi:imidazolonepropionase-like amidohydrolase
MDANVHLIFPTPDLALEFEGRYEELIEEAAQVTLRSGVTTVFDTWGPLAALTAVRDRINRGATVGSRMFVAGNIIGYAGLFSADFFPTGDLFGPDVVRRINDQWEQGVGADLLWLGEREVRQRVRDYVERSGVDFIKYGASGHREFQFITFSAEVQRAIVEEGHRAGLTVQAHSTSPESLRMEIEAGADLLQHGDITGPEPIPAETLKTIVDRALPVAALVCTKRYMTWVAAHGHEAMRGVHNAVQDDNDQRLIDGGARLLLTTDGYVCGRRVLDHPLRAIWTGAPDIPVDLGESHFLWLRAVVERGMAPMDALLAATRNVARAYGQSADLGTLEPGKRADLVILDADPLADPENYRRIAQVLKDGIPVDRDALPARRVVTDEHPRTAPAAAR